MKKFIYLIILIFCLLILIINLTNTFKIVLNNHKRSALLTFNEFEIKLKEHIIDYYICEKNVFLNKYNVQFEDKIIEENFNEIRIQNYEFKLISKESYFIMYLDNPSNNDEVVPIFSGKIYFFNNQNNFSIEIQISKEKNHILYLWKSI